MSQAPSRRKRDLETQTTYAHTAFKLGSEESQLIGPFALQVSSSRCLFPFLHYDVLMYQGVSSCRSFVTTELVSLLQVIG